MPPPVNARRGYVLVCVGAICFVLNAGVSRAIQAAGVDSMTLTTVRCTGTALALVAVVLARRERLHLPGSWRDAARVMGFGITGVALVQWLYFVAIDRLPVGIALLLEFTAPVLVALFARFVYLEPVRRRMWVAIACSLGGLAMVAEVWTGMSLDLVGVLAGFGAALSLACYFLLGERRVSTDSPLIVLTEAFIVASVFWNLIQPVSRLWDTGLSRRQSLGGTLERIDAPVWALLVWLVMLGTVVPFLAELSALQHLSVTDVTLLGMLEPVGAAVLGWLWFRESLSAAQTAGVALVLVGIGLAQTARITKSASARAAPPLVP